MLAATLEASEDQASEEDSVPGRTAEAWEVSRDGTAVRGTLPQEADTRCGGWGFCGPERVDDSHSSTVDRETPEDSERLRVVRFLRFPSLEDLLAAPPPSDFSRYLSVLAC